MVVMLSVRYCISKFSAIRLEVSLQITEKASRSIFHYEPPHILLVVLVVLINVVEKIVYRLQFLFVRGTG